MVIYQPHKPELLINTAWGIPYKELETEAAKARKLFIWNDRWVSQEEWERLKREHRVYSWIHITIMLTTLGGVINTIRGLVMLFGQNEWAVRLEGGITLWLGVVALVVAQLLRRYSPLGRAGAVALGIMHVLSLVLTFVVGEMGKVPIAALVWHAFWLIVIFRLFYSPLGDIVFSEPSAEPAVVKEGADEAAA